MSRYSVFDFQQVRAQPFSQRRSKVRVEQFASTPRAGATFAEFLGSLPALLAGQQIAQVANAIVNARQRGRAVIVCCGGHVIKCGLAPMIIALMERGIITALALNGGCSIHDLEIAFFGATSEEVDPALENGTFGMTLETADFYNRAIARAHRENMGAGESLGRFLVESHTPYTCQSLLATGYRQHIPVTVHIALGTDVVHLHPSTDGAALGATTFRDFGIFTAAMRNLADGGVLLNLGSAVLLPEVVLKGIALLRNESLTFTNFLGVNCDFIPQYRSHQQIVTRLEAIGGAGISLIGHHEILIPLLTFAILEAWEGKQNTSEPD